MTRMRVGPVGVAVVGRRRERRAVVRLWWEPGCRRSGWWLLAGLRPLRVRVGREAPADSFS